MRTYQTSAIRADVSVLSLNRSSNRPLLPSPLTAYPSLSPSPPPPSTPPVSRGTNLRIAFRFLARSRTRPVSYFLPPKEESTIVPFLLLLFLILLLLRCSFVLAARGSLSPTSHRSFFRTNVKSHTRETTAASCEEPDPDG